MGRRIRILWLEWKVQNADQLLPLTDTIDHEIQRIRTDKT